MSLTQEVRRFFANKIYTVIDGKIYAQNKSIDEKKVGQEAIARVLGQLGVPEALKEHEHILKLEKQLQDEEAALNTKLGKAMNADAANSYSCWRTDKWDEIKDQAAKKYSDIIMEEYPEQQTEIKRLQDIRSNVMTAIMLATTEPKLIASLTKLVETYGGDLSELSNMFKQ